MRLRRIYWILGLLVLAYYACMMAILRFDLDPFVFPQTPQQPSLSAAKTFAVRHGGNQLLIRRYGVNQHGCIVFFPGQHGIQANYARLVFPALLQHGIEIYTLSYPGQDGAKGQARLVQLPSLLQAGMSKINTACHLQHAVFVGRSLGTLFASMQAVHWQPKGLLLDSTSPRFSDAIKTYLSSKWYLRPARLLPVRELLRKDYVLRKALDQLPHTEVIIFQGAHDTRTPAAQVKQVLAGRPRVKYFAIEGARHATTYVKALPLYINQIIALLRLPGNTPVNTETH